MFHKGEESIVTGRTTGPRVAAESFGQILLFPGGQIAMPVADPLEHRFDGHHAIRASRQMSMDAGPRPLAGGVTKAGPNRIELDVPNGREKMPFVHHEGSEAVLPQMSAPAFTTVDSMGVAPVNVGTESRQAHLVRRYEDKMHVVRHKAPGPDLEV